MNSVTGVNSATQKPLTQQKPVTHINGREVVERHDPPSQGMRFFYVDDGKRVPICDEPETDPVLIERNERVAKYPRTNTNDTGE